MLTPYGVDRAATLIYRALKYVYSYITYVYPLSSLTLLCLLLAIDTPRILNRRCTNYIVKFMSRICHWESLGLP